MKPRNGTPSGRSTSTRSSQACRLQPGRVLQTEVGAEQGARRRRTTAPRSSSGHQIRRARDGTRAAAPTAARAGRLAAERVRSAAGRVNRSSSDGVHQGAADRRLRRGLGKPVDRPEAVQQRAGLEVRRPRRGQRGLARPVCRVRARARPAAAARCRQLLRPGCSSSASARFVVPGFHPSPYDRAPTADADDARGSGGPAPTTLSTMTAASGSGGRVPRLRRPIGIPLGRIGGIPIILAPSWLVAVVIIVVLAAPVVRQAVPGTGTIGAIWCRGAGRAARGERAGPRTRALPGRPVVRRAGQRGAAVSDRRGVRTRAGTGLAQGGGADRRRRARGVGAAGRGLRALVGSTDARTSAGCCCSSSPWPTA